MGASLAALAALLPISLASGRATPVPASLNMDGTALQQPIPQRVAWEEAKRHKLRHAYWLLEQSDRDYQGHKAKALAEIKKAGEIIGLDLHGEGYGGEHQKWSDARLKEARQLLKDVAQKTGGGEEHGHLRVAIKEINEALEVS